MTRGKVVIVNDTPRGLKTWRDLRSQLPDGLSDDALELIRRATAAERHEQRVAATIDAALAGVLEIYSSPDLEVRRVTPLVCRMAACLIALDRNGTGGRYGAGGGSAATDRMSWARALGKGRRQASDGPAWMAAAADAESLLLDRAARPEAFDPPAVGWSWHPWRGPDSPPECQGMLGPDDVIRVVREVVCGDDMAFARSYCRARLIDLAHRLQNAYHPEYRAEVRAEIAAWDAALRAIDAESAPVEDMAYEINYTVGRLETAATYEEACDKVRAAYPEAEIGHSGDLTDGGDRTLCWASEGDARDDDGRRAVAAIRWAQRE